jgi:hypothetical protein
MGVEPYARNLAESCRQLQQCIGGHFTPASLFRIFFEYILMTVQEHIREKYGGSVETITDPFIQANSAPPLGEIIATIQHGDLEESANQEDNAAQITNSQYLTSYNWLAGAIPQIVVPGEKT